MHTLFPFKSLYWCHFSCRQYSRKNASAYSWPWPLPNRPWVSVHVIRWSLVKSISRYSRIALLIWAFGHQAPPFFSCRILRIFTNYQLAFSYLIITYVLSCFNFCTLHFEDPRISSRNWMTPWSHHPGFFLLPCQEEECIFLKSSLLFYLYLSLSISVLTVCFRKSVQNVKININKLDK